MSYQIICDDNILHDLRYSEYAVVNPKLKMGLNTVGGLTFTIYTNHPNIENIKKLISIIEVNRNDEPLFRGRVMDTTKNFDTSVDVDCEGALGYLNDSIQRPFEFTGTPAELLSFLITRHNSRVSGFQQFSVGNVTVTSSASIYRYDDSYNKTWDCVQNLLVDTLGGYIIYRYENGIQYIDYLAELTDTATQEIKFGENLLDVIQKVSGEDTTTAIIPVGAQLDSDSESNIKAYLTIKSVNNDNDYLSNSDAINAYGVIEKKIEFKDITDAAVLLTSGQSSMATQGVLGVTLTIKAVDLNLTDAAIEAFDVGDNIHIYSPVHNLDKTLLLQNIDIDMTKPANTSITLGDDYTTFSDVIGRNLNAVNKKVTITKDDVVALKKTTNTVLTVANGAQSTANNAMTSATANAQDLANYITGNKSALADIQSQIDGSITTWFYAAAPTNSNVPASEWTTTTLKNTHLGDLYYDTTTGYCYRWQVVSQTYSWSRVSDVDVTKALADAAAAQDTADAKRRVFVNTPVPPYDVGDLWAQGSGGDVLKCIAAKTAAQSYVATDWGSASKYTDDTTANSVQSDLNNNYTDTSGMTDAINLKFGQITLTVEAGTGANAGKLFVKVNGGGTDKQGTIDLTGLVKFTDLETAGSTTINGGNITTGTINANLINGGTISSSVLASFNGDDVFGIVLDKAKVAWKKTLNGASWAQIKYILNSGLAISSAETIALSSGNSITLNGFDFSKLGTHFATWANYGRCVDTNYSFNYYANLVMTALSPTNVVLKMTGKVGTNYNSASYYQYGISISMLTAQITSWMATLGRTVSSVTYNSKSQWLVWNYGTGALMTGYMQYGTCFQVDTGSGVLRPARVYTTSGDVGGWEIGTWYTNAAYFEATIFANLA